MRFQAFRHDATRRALRRRRFGRFGFDRFRLPLARVDFDGALQEAGHDAPPIASTKRRRVLTYRSVWPSILEMAKRRPMLIVQAIRHRDTLVIPARVAGLVPVQQQDGAAARVEGVQHPIGTTGVLEAQLAQMSVFRGGDAAAVRIPQVGAELAEQFDAGFDRFLLRFGPRSPPVAKLVGVFHFPFQGRIIAFFSR